MELLNFEQIYAALVIMLLGVIYLPYLIKVLKELVKLVLNV